MILAHVGLVGTQGTALLLCGTLHAEMSSGTHVPMAGVGGDKTGGSPCAHIPEREIIQKIICKLI